jgi:hypothetical protein
MTPRLIIRAGLVLLAWAFTSCYKTGEIIYQPTCKPAAMDLPGDMYHLLNINYTFFSGKFNYTGTNGRLNYVTHDVLGKLAKGYNFRYDENNNLVRVDTYDRASGIPLPVIYVIYHYPPDTRNSIADNIDVQAFSINPDYFSYTSGPLLTYRYNTEFQLTSIWSGPQLRETYDYDAGGNCTKNTVYDINNNISTWYEYNAYDDKINPARSDRALQLFLNIYSKNNPTDMKRMVMGLGGTGVPGELAHNVGAYTYNTNGYPITFRELFFASYTCWN